MTNPGLEPAEITIVGTTVSQAQWDALVASIAKIQDDIKQIRLQWCEARPFPNWPSLGLNSAGKELTPRDSLGNTRDTLLSLVTYLKTKLGTP